MCLFFVRLIKHSTFRPLILEIKNSLKEFGHLRQLCKSLIRQINEWPVFLQKNSSNLQEMLFNVYAVSNENTSIISNQINSASTAFVISHCAYGTIKCVVRSVTDYIPL